MAENQDGEGDTESLAQALDALHQPGMSTPCGLMYIERVADAAHMMGAHFEHNGQVRKTDHGRTMITVAKDLDAEVLYPHGRGRSPIVYLFDDGSAVVEEDGGWDYRAKDCHAHCWAGVGCQCATTDVREAVRGYDGHSALCGTWSGPPTDAANDDARRQILEGLRTAGFHVFTEDLAVLNDGTWKVDAHDEPEEVC